MKRLILALTVAVVAAVANAAVPQTAQASGNWEDVCCGASCGYADYCLGNGTKTCCKEEIDG